MNEEIQKNNEGSVTTLHFQLYVLALLEKKYFEGDVKESVK
jgi:hypothetical protein